MKTSKIMLIITTLLFSQVAFPQRRISSIRSIDFTDFTYPGSKGLFPTAEYETKSFRLHKGKSGDWREGMTLEKVVYGDVTGDRVEEAIIIFSVNTEGSAAVNHVYIYTLKYARPKFLWGFESGDRAWGGLKRVYAEGGDLVVELYGRGTQIEGNLGSTEPVGLCCPRSFTRTRYQWRNNRFRQHGRMKILSISEKNGSISRNLTTY